MEVKHNEEVDDFLAHYGVLGMKWGVRKQESKERIERGNHSSPKDPKKVGLTKQEYKSLSKEARSGYRKKTKREIRETNERAIQENADMTVAAAMRGKNDVLIRVGNRHGGPPVVITGQEFVNHLEKGGLFDIRVTEIHGYANTPTGLTVKRVVDEIGAEIWNPTRERYVKK